MGHALFEFMRKNTDTKLMDPARAAKFQNKLAELYTRLGNETINIKRGVTISATDIVDPSIWGGLAPEHPGKDVDEFFASAKSAFQTDKKRLVSAIQKFGKGNSNILFAGAELIHLLDSFFSNGELPEANEKIQNEKNAAAQVAGISPASGYEGSIGTSPLLQYLVSKTC